MGLMNSMVMKFRNNMVVNSDVEMFKQLNNKMYGVTVKIMPAKMYGCFQPNFSAVRIELNSSCIGRTCNGSDFLDNERKVKNIVFSYYSEFERY